MTSTTKTILIDAIRIDGGTQQRVELNQEVIDNYAEAITNGVKMPAITVFFDSTDYWIADGNQRLLAHKKAGKVSIEAEVHTGTQRDAILFSAGANASHGLPRSNADKRKAVLLLLNDAEWSQWSDREIAKKCSVSHTFVANARMSLATVASEKPEERVRIDKHGNTGTVKVGKIGKGAGTIAEPAAPPAPPPTQPAAPQPTPEKTEAEQIAEDAYSGVEKDELLEALQKEVDALRKIIAAAEEDDQKAATIKWKRIADLAQRRQNELMDTVNHREKELKKLNNYLRRMSEFAGEEDYSKLVAWVEKRSKAVKVVPA